MLATGPARCTALALLQVAGAQRHGHRDHNVLITYLTVSRYNPLQVPILLVPGSTVVGRPRSSDRQWQTTARLRG
eukprot:3170219-Rhodomonas_salina.1